MKKLIIFDLDGTLAKSKSAIDKEMAGLLRNLLEVHHVALISGAAWPQFKKTSIKSFAKEFRADETIHTSYFRNKVLPIQKRLGKAVC